MVKVWFKDDFLKRGHRHLFLGLATFWRSTSPIFLRSKIKALFNQDQYQYPFSRLWFSFSRTFLFIIFEELFIKIRLTFYQNQPQPHPLIKLKPPSTFYLIKKPHLDLWKKPPKLTQKLSLPTPNFLKLLSNKKVIEFDKE